ncbi:MAG: metal-dependent transcriptional regulator [Firmicutes bacterium]|nr:metal-dependent transcriptional regulator [Bacillota bacterium]MCL1954029.1 metal-dependent transcriptional regulator [Bacillota bacterium]
MGESAEMYLETIYILLNQLGEVRAVDISRKMNFSKASVSNGLKKLLKQNLIDKDKNECITLTTKGLEKAKMLFDRYSTITRFLEIIGVPTEVAQQDACKMEHTLSETSFECIKQHVYLTDNLGEKTIRCII